MNRGSLFPLTAVSLLCMTTLIALIVLSSLEQSLASGLAVLTDHLWGITTLVDLYFGLLLIGLWIVWVERRPLRFIPWLVALAALGNLASLAYVAVRSLKCASMNEFLTSRAAPYGG